MCPLPTIGKQLKPDYLRQLEFSIEDATRTKATLDPASGKYAWEEGDEILVMNGKSHAVFTLESGNVFSTDTPDFLATEDYTAIYPASAVISPEPAPANISLNIADSQVYDGESVKGQILYAQSSQKSIEMRSLMAVVEFLPPLFPSVYFPSRRKNGSILTSEPAATDMEQSFWNS